MGCGIRHKAEYGQAGCELEIVGKDFVDNDAVARALRTTGLLRPVDARAKL